MDIKQYYAKRTKEYEEIYNREDSSRKKELKDIENALKKVFQGRKVLEIACGTGYWTQFTSETANSLVATDIVDEVLDIAKTTKKYSCPIEFLKQDAFNLKFPNSSFDGGLANFWFSHLKITQRIQFLEGFHKVLKEGSQVFMADNVYNKGIGGKFVNKDGEKNTYKLRTLKDGTETLVLKNYPTKEELETIFSNYASGLNIYFGNHYWYLSYVLKK